ncbi:4-hydroxyphenylpyruvate dioxygenase [Artemisia annua]|uniref:4-hydroxyphenylpyruvate dioxygenase n=1 Tax=Artemisia annua TaxID=35608 RepID=A0A2U1MF76_ARTAN|nr:4-hydroxyphenylpyruvate dioxygenase [Artemisia annua]
MRKRSGAGGFEFISAPPPTYYRNFKKNVGDVLSDEQIKECEEIGILVDRGDEGTLLQIFTKPVDDEGKSGCGRFGKVTMSSSLPLKT